MSIMARQRVQQHFPHLITYLDVLCQYGDVYIFGSIVGTKPVPADVDAVVVADVYTVPTPKADGLDLYVFDDVLYTKGIDGWLPVQDGAAFDGGLEDYSDEDDPDFTEDEREDAFEEEAARRAHVQQELAEALENAIEIESVAWCHDE